jgi:hypothetical protein
LIASGPPRSGSFCRDARFVVANARLVAAEEDLGDEIAVQRVAVMGWTLP